MIMRKFNWKKSVAIALSTVCMVGALAGCGSSSSDNGNDSAKAEKLNGSITAAGSSALKPLVDDAADLFNEKYPDVNITIDAGGSGEGLKQVSEGTVNIGNSDVEAAEKLAQEPVMLTYTSLYIHYSQDVLNARTPGLTRD